MPVDVDGRGCVNTEENILAEVIESLRGRLSSFGFSGTIAHGLFGFGCGHGQAMLTVNADPDRGNGVYASLLRAIRSRSDQASLLLRQLVIMWIEAQRGAKMDGVVDRPERRQLCEVQMRGHGRTRCASQSAGGACTSVVAKTREERGDDAYGEGAVSVRLG